MKNMRYCLIMLMLFSLLAGCGAKGITSFVREEVPFDFVRKVAVMPLQNNTDNKYAVELARDVINTQILAMELFDVVDKGIVDSISFGEALKPGAPMDQLKLERLGQRLNVQALMLGSVDLAGEKRSGSISVPEVSLTLRLVEIKAGTILWQASGHNDGDSMLGRLFGLNSSDSYQITQQLVRRMLSTVPEGTGGTMQVVNQSE